MIKNLGKYTIKRTIGEGAMGIVYEALDPVIERRVAIKMVKALNMDSVQVAEFHTRFKIEAQAAARCMHANIVTILEYDNLDGMPYMVMEFIEGCSLGDVLLIQQPLKLNRVLKIISQLLKGLYFAHNNGVVHRDIKPSNIMIMQNDEIKITDFGIARIPLSNSVTQTGFSVGTPNYMAPEQLYSSEIDGRADLFALGIIFLELLAKVPFSEKIHLSELSTRSIYITPKVNVNLGIPTPFTRIIEKALASSVDKRFADAREFASALKHAVNEVRVVTGGQHENEATKIYQPAINVNTRPGHLAELESMLMPYLGPISSSLIDIYSEETSNMDDLIKKLAAEIPSEGDRSQFIENWSTGKSAAALEQEASQNIQTTSPSNLTLLNRTPILNSAAIHELNTIYADYVGPMAEILLEDNIHQSNSIDELITSLSDAIHNEREKSEFRTKVKQCLLSH